jgi:hypothetical protein
MRFAKASPLADDVSFRKFLALDSLAFAYFRLLSSTRRFVSSRKARGVSNDSNGFIVLCVCVCVVVVVVVVVVFRRRRRKKGADAQKQTPSEILTNEKAFASFYFKLAFWEPFFALS